MNRIGGRELSANWSIEARAGGHAITFESRSGKRGTKTERNADYKQALALILGLLGARGYVLADTTLASAKALELEPDPEARRIHIAGVGYPITLQTIDDYSELGRAIQRATAGMFSERQEPGGGNREKRITLVVHPTSETPPGHDLAEWITNGDTAPGRRHNEAAFAGAEYVPVEESVALNHSGTANVDPAAVERGLSGHRRTQNALAAFIAARGLKPLKPRSGDPDFDLAWIEGDTLFVAEVKSVTDLNETGQLRLGLGQVLHYRHRLARSHHGPVRAVIAAERAPTDQAWLDICDELGITLTWPPFSKLGR